jgi:nitroimidazol reductase NimA-like FMN-containing flavoprotein (pyridoxamine 5'-phosphate oxidase superfamily)
MTQRHIEELSAAACKELLRNATVGRIIFVDDNGPSAWPVNYGVAEDRIVFRIEQHSSLRNFWKGPIAFEVDHIEEDALLGWSVLVRGTASEVPIARVPELTKLMKSTLPRPWAEGIHNVWVSIEPEVVTGRKLTDAIVATL